LRTSQTSGCLGISDRWESVNSRGEIGWRGRFLAPGSGRTQGGEDPAGEEGAEPPLHEAGDDAAPIAGRGEKGLEVMLCGAVEHGVFGYAPLVVEGIGKAVTSESVARHEQERVRVACLQREASCLQREAS
jgi:hypothetical protein